MSDLCENAGRRKSISQTPQTEGNNEQLPRITPQQGPPVTVGIGHVTFLKVTLKRNTEGTTAKEPVVRENHRRNHSQRACDEKDEVK